MNVLWFVEKTIFVFLYKNKFFRSSKETREKSQRVKRWKRMAYIGAAGGLGAVLIGLTSGLAAPLVASGIGAITTSGAIAGLATSTGAAIFGSIFGVAGGSLAGYRMKVCFFSIQN